MKSLPSASVGVPRRALLQPRFLELVRCHQLHPELVPELVNEDDQAEGENSLSQITPPGPIDTTCCGEQGPVRGQRQVEPGDPREPPDEVLDVATHERLAARRAAHEDGAWVRAAAAAYKATPPTRSGQAKCRAAASTGATSRREGTNSG